MSKVTEELTRIREILEEGQSGGGSNDVTTATVTVSNGTGATSITVNIPILGGDSYAQGDYAGAGILFNRDVTEREVTIPLYKGCAVATVNSTYEFEVTSGNAEIDETRSFRVYIHGDCELNVLRSES